MPEEKGNISINTENILPIIKKWLYSEKDIFVREIVSNSNDAVIKLKKLASIGEAEIGEGEKFYIRVIVNKDKKTIQVVDNGIGMTGDEVKKYINQIAFSGAVDFLEKYKDKTDEGSQIIGHFGLGFYSAFMVSEKVSIDTLSWQKGAEAVKWTSSGGTEFEMEESDRSERGTTVTMYLSDDALEFLDDYKIKETLEKYCFFMPVEIYLEDACKKKEDKKESGEDKEAKADTAEKGGEVGTPEKAGESEETKDKGENAEKGGGAEKSEEASEAAEKPINDTHPLWLKNPRDCTDEEYKEFYKKVFHDFNDPLFWIHLNMDYPFNLKGILYFPKLKHEFETIEGQIKLYYNQVFVADNIKEVIPEFLMLLKGAIDCPDLPLNVSRSFLQNDGYVSKISSHITKKVADKLTSLFENERENYNKYWDDINPFVKYGCIREEKFYDRVKDIVIFKTTNGEYVTQKDYIEKYGDKTREKNNDKDKEKDRIFYVTDENQQSQYIRIFKEYGIDAVILSTLIDNHFIQFLEMKENKIKFTRIDSDLSDSLKSEDGADKKTELSKDLEKIFKEALENDKLKINIEALKKDSVPAMILLSEYSRRMQEMSRMYGMNGMNMNGMFPDEQTLVLNSNNPLIQSVVKMAGSEDKKEDVKLICRHVYDLAMMSHKQLSPDEMTKFIERSNMLLSKLAENA